MFKKIFPGRGSYIARFIDKYAGVPLVAALGATRKARPLPPMPPQKIALLLSVAIGDSLLLLSVVRALKKKFPNTEITIFAGESNTAFVKQYFEAKVIPIAIMDPPKAKEVIKKAGTFDVWIDTGQWQRITALYTHFAAAEFKIGFQTPGQGRHFAFDHAVPHLDTVHEIENYRNLVLPLGVSEFENPVLPNPEKMEKDKIILHAFAGGSKPHLKEWPVAYWTEVINSLTARGKKIFLTGVQADKVAAEEIRNSVVHPENVVVLAGVLSLTDTIKELGRAEQVISVNTGILHVAAALGVPTIGIHGPTSVKRWGPIGPKAIAIQSPRFCSPCLHLGFDYGCPRNDCMKDLKPVEILDLLS